MSDVLLLGGVAFTDFSTPESMGAGGRQSLVVHKLPGGSRVIDVLGPDEAEIRWTGKFFGNGAYNTALTLDALRASGQVLPLTWAGQYRSVIIQEFSYHIRRLPLWVEYDISCVVYQNPMLGSLAAASSSVDALVTNDLGTAATFGVDITSGAGIFG